MQGGRFGPGTPVVGKVRPTGLCICQQPRQVSDGRWSLARMPGAGASRRAMVVGTAWPISLATSNRGGCRGLPKLTNRKSVGQGKGVAGSVSSGGRGKIKKKKQKQ